MIRPFAIALTLACTSLSASWADEVILAAEHAEVIRLPGTASAVVVGNPSIADALVHDGRTLILTGRLQGRTNVIAIDRIGRVIFEAEVVVSNHNDNQIAMFRGPNRFTLSCGDICDEIPRVGDDTGRTDALGDQQLDRLATANAALADDDAGN